MFNPRTYPNSPPWPQSLRAWLSHPQVLPKGAVVHFHGIWTSLYEPWVLFLIRPELRWVISEWDPKAYPTLETLLTFPGECPAFTKCLDVLSPTPFGCKPLEHILKQFQKHMFSRCTFLRDATSQATADLTSIEPFPNLHVLASRGNVPKAHLIFCHAVQLNPLQVAKVHLRPGGTLFYSVHRDDSPENIRRGFNPEPPFCYRFLPKAKNPMLLNPLVGSFPTHPGVHGIMHGELGSQAPWV